MVDFFSGLLGIEEDPLLAMLPPEQRAQLMARTRQQGIQNLGLQLLQAGGPTTTPGGIGSRLGGAIMGAQQSSQGMMDANLQRLLAARKLQEEQASQQRRERVLSSISPEYRDLYDVSPSLFADVLKSKIIPGERKTAVVGNTLVDVATGQPVYQGQQERKTQTVGNQIVDVNTGEVVFTAPKDEKPPKTREVNVGNKILLINDETGQTIREFPVGLSPQARKPSEVSYKPETDATGRLVYVPQKPGLPVLDQSGKPVTDFKPAMTAQEVKAKERLEGPQKVVNLLETAKGLVSTATGSYIGAGVDILSNVIGYAPEGQRAIQQLKAIETQLVLNMPRLEGPQSNFDAQLYKEAAGKIGDPTLPADAKMAAINTIQDINIKYGGAAAPQPVEEPSKAKQSGGQIPTIKTQGEYDKLPKGATYIGPDGTRRRKQ